MVIGFELMVINLWTSVNIELQSNITDLQSKGIDFCSLTFSQLSLSIFLCEYASSIESTVFIVHESQV